MLINCAAYRDGLKLADISVADISDYLAQPGTLVWVALLDPSQQELQEMQQEFSLHDLAVENAMSGHQRAKIEEYGDSVFAVLHTVELDDGQLHTGEVDVFVGPNHVLSVRHQTRHGFADVRARCEREPQLLRFGSGFVLYALMDSVVDRYFPVLDALEDELNQVESAIFGAGGKPRDNIQALYVLKQKLNTLRHAVFPLMEASGKLHGGRVPQAFAGTQEYFRDVNNHLSRINQSIDSIRDMLATAIQVNLSLIALAEGEVNKKLAAWAAIIAVPTMIAGIYGMNFRHMPELGWAGGYPLALCTMLLIDAWLFRQFKKTGWL